MARTNTVRAPAPLDEGAARLRAALERKRARVSNEFEGITLEQLLAAFETWNRWGELKRTQRDIVRKMAGRMMRRGYVIASQSRIGIVAHCSRTSVNCAIKGMHNGPSKYWYEGLVTLGLLEVSDRRNNKGGTACHLYRPGFVMLAIARGILRDLPAETSAAPDPDFQVSRCTESAPPYPLSVISVDVVSVSTCDTSHFEVGGAGSAVDRPVRNADARAGGPRVVEPDRRPARKRHGHPVAPARGGPAALAAQQASSLVRTVTAAIGGATGLSDADRATLNKATQIAIATGTEATLLSVARGVFLDRRTWCKIVGARLAYQFGRKLAAAGHAVPPAWAAKLERATDCPPKTTARRVGAPVPLAAILPPHLAGGCDDGSTVPQTISEIDGIHPASAATSAGATGAADNHQRSGRPVENAAPGGGVSSGSPRLPGFAWREALEGGAVAHDGQGVHETPGRPRNGAAVRPGGGELRGRRDTDGAGVHETPAVGHKPVAGLGADLLQVLKGEK